MTTLHSPAGIGQSVGENEPILEGLRVLEVSHSIAGAYAGRMFADLGAEVLVSEPVGGHPLRRGLNIDSTSPLFSFLMRGKIATTRLWSDVAVDADLILFESIGPPDTALLTRLSEDRAVVAITPWGLTGAWAEEDRPWTDFTIQAEAGSLSNRGVPESYPVGLGGYEHLWAAGSIAATAGMAAVLAADKGRGELVDVSLLEATNYTATMFSTVAAAIAKTASDPTPVRRVLLPSVEKAADGWVGFNLASAQNLEDFLILIERAEWIDDKDWRTPESRYRRYDEFSAAVREWTTKRTVAEIVEQASLFRIPCAPVNNGQTILEDEHVLARRFYIRDATDSYTHPGTPMLFDGVRPEGPAAPLLSAANVGFAPRETRSQVCEATNSLPLQGLRVVDCGNWWVGSLVGTLLGSLGADVIKIESTRRVDGARMLGGTITDRENWWEYGWIHLATNHNKRGVTLDLTEAGGRELISRLIAKSDILLENFSPRVMENAGFTWEAVRNLNPGVLMLRMPAYGLSGPRRDMVGYAQTVEQYSGMCWRTGYPEGTPLNPSGPADPMGGFNAAFALLAALRRRTQTGRGMHIECPLAEAALVMASEQVLEFTAHGTLLGRDGNHRATGGPQGVYAGAGVEQWIAISVTTDAQWQALADLTQIPRWKDPTLETAENRWHRRTELDEDLIGWMYGRDVSSTVTALLEAGVPAAKAHDQRFSDRHPQIASRSYFETTEDPVRGAIPTPILPFTFSRVEAWSYLSPPTVGRDNVDVLSNDLGLSDEEIADLSTRGMIGDRPAGT